jgi:multiple antibiotic resistance protein
VPNYDQLFNSLVTLMVTIDPPGLAPLFLVLTKGMDRSQRRQVAVRASIIAFIILSLFAAIGIAVLSVFGITIAAFRVAGGFLLFYIAFEMIFERRQQRHEQSAETAITRDMIHNIAAFPLAIPLIAGPGAISATILLADASGGVQGRAALIGIIGICIATSYIVFMLAERVDKFLGHTGRSILTRLLGLILAALAVQFVADGIRILVQAS